MADFFLRKDDYFRLIQVENLDIVTTATELFRQENELATEEQIKSYIRQRYDVAYIFAPLQDFNPANTYFWGDRLYLTATPFNPLTTYIIGDRVSINGNVYEDATGHVAGPFNVIGWTLLWAEGHYQMQASLWDDEITYTIGQTVRYENGNVRKWYKALTINTGKNPFIDTFANWVEVKSITGAILPTDTNYWVFGDSRNKHMMMIFIDVALYHLHSRINPRNIPEFRIVRYGDCMQYLKDIGRGLVTADLELIAPEQGNNITFGSTPVQNNFY